MFNRVFALVSRYCDLVLGSIPRLISVFWWPSIQIVLWGFFSKFLDEYGTSPYNAMSILLTAVILWDILFRGQLGLSITFFEEIWSRNLGHLFITPLRDIELILGLIITSLVRTILGMIPAIFISIYYFDLNLILNGIFFIIFFFNLIFTGWSIGFIVSGLVLRYGQSYEELAWAFIFLLLPFACVYYPLDSLPIFIQKISVVISPVYVFEGMRELMAFNKINYNYLFYAFFLNMIYLLTSIIFFKKMIRSTKNIGKLINFGE